MHSCLQTQVVWRSITWELCHRQSHRLQKENDSPTLKQNSVVDGKAQLWISCSLQYLDIISVFSKITCWYAARRCFFSFVSRKLSSRDAGKAERFDPRVPQQTGCHAEDSGFLATIFFIGFFQMHVMNMRFGSSCGSDCEDRLLWHMMLHNIVNSNQY